MFEGLSVSGLKDIGIVSMCFLFTVALARNWLYTSGQMEKMISGYERLADTWEAVATQQKETIELLTLSVDPIIQGNEAILRAVESLQKERETPRQRNTQRRAG